MRIIPALDIIDGKCVRLQQGDYSQITHYNEDPLEVAKRFEDFGIKFLHLVDLDGARSKRIINHKILESIASKTSLQIDFGGGLKSNEDVQIAFDSGAQQITGGSIAVDQPELFLGWLEKYGSDKIILGADGKTGSIAIHGWTQQSEWEVTEFIAHFEKKGVKQVICTDIEKDGMLAGPSLELYKTILQKTGIQLIASGGITTIEDLQKLKEIGCEGAIIGKALYEGKLTLTQLEKLC